MACIVLSVFKERSKGNNAWCITNLTNDLFAMRNFRRLTTSVSNNLDNPQFFLTRVFFPLISLYFFSDSSLYATQFNGTCKNQDW